MISIKKLKLFESPDHILINNDNKEICIKYYEEDCAKPFAFSPLMKNGKTVYDNEGYPVIDKLWVGDFGEGHSDDCTLEDEDGRKIDYYDLLYKGRLWFEYNGKTLNIISFWDSLEKEELEKVIKELAYETGINFSNWSIDVGTESEECEHCHGEGYTDKDGDCEYCNGEGCLTKTKLIPLKDYKGGIKIGEEEKAIHLMSWEEKQKLKREKGWGRGWGSDMTAWDSKNPLQWRQAKYQENKVLKFKDFKYDKG